LIRTASLLLLLGALGLVVGCGPDEAGAAPEVKVSADQRAKDVNAEAANNIQWLESLPAGQRQAAVDRVPQLKASLKGVTDPALKQRIHALGIRP
jgi:hypothetical protein